MPRQETEFKDIVFYNSLNSREKNYIDSVNCVKLETMIKRERKVIPLLNFFVLVEVHHCFGVL